MWLGRLAAIALAAAACGPSVLVGSAWNADTGIYGTYDHFGNPPNGPASFICGVGYDLRYRGRVPLIQLVTVIVVGWESAGPRHPRCRSVSGTRLPAPSPNFEVGLAGASLPGCLGNVFLNQLPY